MKVLFLGNSHTYYNDMPQIFAEMCRERGREVQVVMQAHPGVTYGWHLKQHTELRFALIHGGFDYIVMQQAAHAPWPPTEETRADAKTIITMARENGVRPIQAVPWAEKDCPEHQAEMYAIYHAVQKDNDVPLTVTGRVFEEVFHNYPEIPMYWNDGQHASPYGSYTAALATYAAIFGERVSGMSPNSYETFRVSDAAWAELMQAKAAAEQHPKDRSLLEKRRALQEKYLRAAGSKAEARVVLDADKAAVLQRLVDRFAFGE